MGELTEDHTRRLAWGVEFLMDLSGIPRRSLPTNAVHNMFGTLGGNMRAASNYVKTPRCNLGGSYLRILHLAETYWWLFTSLTVA